MKFGIVITAGIGKVDIQHEAITLPPMVIFKAKVQKALTGTFPKDTFRGGHHENSIMKDQDVFFSKSNLAFCQITFGRCS